MRWPWRRRKAKPVEPPSTPPPTRDKNGGKPDARRCWICNATKVERIVYDPITDSRRHLLYCVKCDHITRKASP